MENKLKDFLEEAVTMGKTRLKHAIIEKLKEYYQAGYMHGIEDASERYAGMTCTIPDCNNQAMPHKWLCQNHGVKK